MPGPESFRRNQGGQFMKHTPAQLLGLDDLSPALIVIQAQSFACELWAQYAVLFLEIVDDLLLLLAQAARERNQQQPKRIERQTHYAIVAPCERMVRWLRSPRSAFP